MAETGDVKLASQWSYWYSPRGRNSRPTAATNYESNLTHIGDVTTLKEFFSYYCFLKRPAEVPIDQKMIFFRKGHLPTWEVPLNSLTLGMAKRWLLDSLGKEKGGTSHL